MTMSPETSSLHKPAGDDRIPAGTLYYFRARNRNRIYDAVLREFLRSGISKATLARRMGKKHAEIISRLLGAPGNWTLDTVSDLIFAINGGECEYSIRYPLDEGPHNYTAEWFPDDPASLDKCDTEMLYELHTETDSVSDLELIHV